MPSWLTIKFSLIVCGALLALNGFNYYRLNSERAAHELCKINLTTATNNVMVCKAGITRQNAALDAFVKGCIVSDAKAKAKALEASKKPISIPSGTGADSLNEFMKGLFQ